MEGDFVPISLYQLVLTSMLLDPNYLDYIQPTKEVEDLLHTLIATAVYNIPRIDGAGRLHFQPLPDIVTDFPHPHQLPFFFCHVEVQ